MTGSPSALAARTRSTLRAVERCSRWMRAPVRRHSSMSRWTISSSATAGQPGRPSSLQHWPSCITAPVRQAADLAVLGEDDVETERVLHRPAHQQRVLHAVAVVGEEAHPGVGELGERRQLLARPADRDAAGRQHLAQPGRLTLGPHEVDDATRVLGRVGVRHRHDGRVATERGGPGPGLDRLGLLLARLAQVGVEVDEPRRHDAAAGIEHRVGVAEVGSDGDDLAVVDEDVGDSLPRLVQHSTAADQRALTRPPPRQRWRRAGRTARPSAPPPRW